MNRVVPRDDVMTAAETLAHTLCESSPLVVRAMKEVLQRCQDMTFADALAYSQAVFAPVRETDAAKEGAPGRPHLATRGSRSAISGKTMTRARAR